MLLVTRVIRCLAAAALLLAAPAARAAVRVTATDDRGVTFEVTVPDYAVSAPAHDGRVTLKVPGFHTLTEPGRGQIPAVSALFALPPGATARVRVLSEDGVEAREGVDLEINGKPAFVRDTQMNDYVPTLEDVPVVSDGSWPPERLTVGRLVTLRGRRFQSVEVRPFRWDPHTRRLDVVRRVVVRLEFSTPASVGARAPGAGATDAHFDGVVESSVLNFEQARDWRVAPGGPASFRDASVRVGPFAASSALAFDEDQPEVRVKLDSTGLYVLPFDDIAAQGYPTNVPIAEVSVHRHEFLEGADPPYGTIEMPIEVYDLNSNGVFDSGDELWLYTQSWAQRSGVSFGQRRWGDAEVLFVTRKTGGGLRMATRPGWRNAAAPTVLSSYPWTQRFERNFEYTAFPKDTSVDIFMWTPSPTFYYFRDDTIRFETNHLDTTRAATVSVMFDGRDLDSHWLWAQVKNGSGVFTSVVDSFFTQGKGPLQPAPATLFGSALSEGRTNTFRIWGKTRPSPPSSTNNQTNATLNWFDVTYWRRFRALRGALTFNSADAVGEFQLHAFAFGSTVPRLYDVTSPANPVHVDIAPAQLVNEGVPGWAFDLQDSAATGTPRQYVAAVTPRIPDPTAYTPVTRRNLAGALAADYLLVVPEAFLPAVQPLVNLRQAQGLRVLVAPLESLNDEFNGGRKSAYAIRRFTRFAYQKWDSRFLLLVGDGSQNPLQYGSDATDPDYVPVRFVPSAVTVNEGAETITSDGWYGCLTGDCDPIGGRDSLALPEMFVGRLPVHSRVETDSVVAKLVRYEDLSGDQSWRRKVMLQSDDCYSTTALIGSGSDNTYCYRFWEEYFQSISVACSTVIARDAGLAQMQTEVFSNRYYLAGEATSIVNGDTCRGDLNATIPRARANIQPPMFSRLNEGRLWWNYEGHANSQLLAHENFYVNQGLGSSDASLFENYNRPFFWSAFSCHANAHAYVLRIDRTHVEAIGAEMLLLPGRGAIATYASTGFEIVPRTTDFHINTYLARYLFERPPHDEMLGDRGARVVLGEAIHAALLEYLDRPDVQASVYERAVGFTYNLLGDPATRLSIGAPQSAVTANGVAVTNGSPVRLHTAGDTVRVQADLVSTVRLDSLGLWQRSASGETAIPAGSWTTTPAFPDTGAASVTGGRRYQLVYRAPLEARSYSYVIRTKDRYGLSSDFVVPFELRSILRVDGSPIADGDDVSPVANLSLLVLSPKPLDPQADLTLTINGQPQSFVATGAPGDGSGREWILSWTHEAYPKRDYAAVLSVAGGQQLTRTYKVTTEAGQVALRNAFAFPNPFDDDLGAFFSFSLAGSEPADIKISVFTQTGRVIYQRVERGLGPGYHQIAWDGRDAEGDKLANGVYFYRLSMASAGGAKQDLLGRLVKLRKPRRVAEPTIP